MATSLIRSLRLILEKAQEAPSLPSVLETVDSFAAELSQSQDGLNHFEEQLQELHHEVTDYSSTYHTEIFLAVLYHLEPVLSPTSVISWFDLVLRPALREPKLPTFSLNHAKELVISALQKTQGVWASQVEGFRRRLLELYLLDAYNEGSGTDVLEWAELKQEEQVRRTRWKHNLQDILIAYGHKRPDDLLTEMDRQFATPTHRLQLLLLLNKYTSDGEFYKSTPVFASHNIVQSLWNCLLFDNSSTVCTAALSLVCQLLPYFAVSTSAMLKSALPTLFAILARVVCWRERPPPASVGRYDPAFERELYIETHRVLMPRPDLGWERLAMTFKGTIPVPPSSRPYFTILYYLFPANTLRFIRKPLGYVAEHELDSPYTIPWVEAFDQDEIRRKSENLMREHICHPYLVWCDAASELAKPPFWSKFDVPRIGCEATMLDIRYLAIGLRERYGIIDPPVHEGHESAPTSHFVQPVDLSSGKVVISLQDMIDASVALKSNIDVEVTKPYGKWSSSMFPPPDVASSSGEQADKEDVPVMTSADKSMAHVAEVISGLQKEVLLLRNELNFELWHSRENAKHVGRLYEDRILIRSAENERQGLYNKLRKYRSQVTSLENELRDVKQQTAGSKNRYGDWTKELQDKLKNFREERKKLLGEASDARSAEQHLQVLFTAQGKRLEEALVQVFALEAEKKQTAKQIERLQDCERQINELTKLRQAWEDDSRTFGESKQAMDRLQQENSALRERVAALEGERGQSQSAQEGAYKRHIQSLELRLAQLEGLAGSSATLELSGDISSDEESSEEDGDSVNT